MLRGSTTRRARHGRAQCALLCLVLLGGACGRSTAAPSSDVITEPDDAVVARPRTAIGPAESAISSLVQAAEATATAARLPPTAGDAVTFFGRDGSFGTLPVQPDDGVATVAVPGWGFLPGTAAYFAAVDAVGRVVMANEPQIDRQFRPTSATMGVSVFDPRASTFTNVVIPTSSGARSAVAADGSGVGGADVGDLQFIGPVGREQLVVVSMAPYNGWDPARSGIYPSMAVLDDDLGNWQASSSQFTGDELRRSSPAGAAACGRELLTPSGSLADCGGLAEIDQLPRSELLVATRYFGHPEAGGTSGGLAVLDPDGLVVASLDYPTVTIDGRVLQIRPREVDVDPTSPAGDERFLVVFDVIFDPATPSPFVAQEFRFDSVRSTIEAVSAPFTTGGVVDGHPVGVETALYDHHGNLWIAESVSGSLDGERLVRYDRDAGRRRLEAECGAEAGNVGARWSLACPPDFASDVTADHSLVRSLTEDVERSRLVAVTLDGAVAVVDSVESRVAVTLPLAALAGPGTWIGPRKGAIDDGTSRLWIPIQQVRDPSTCPVDSCPPTSLDQWLVRVDLAEI